MIKTNLSNTRNYSSNEVVRIVNIKQQILYMKNNVYPIDMYTSIDDKTDNNIIAMVFLKEDTAEVYKKWKNYELD